MWYVPEHTLPAYYFSFMEGAHFIDVDLQPTKDGGFVVYHDPVLMPHEIWGLPEHPSIFTAEKQIKEMFVNKINRNKYPAGSGWFVKDFTSSELKNLKHKMRYNVDVTQAVSDLPGAELGRRPGYFDSQFEIITLEEAIDYILELN